MCFWRSCYGARVPLTGLALPITATRVGRSARDEGDDHAAKILMIALSDCDNDNAFQQDRGLGSSMVFEVSTESLKAKILARIRTVFDDLERALLFKLVESSIQWSEGPVQGELTMSLRYIDLESDEQKTFAQTFGGGA